jgi:hypothetical protein
LQEINKKVEIKHKNIAKNKDPPMTQSQLKAQIEKDVARTFGYRKYFKENNPG